MSLRIWLPLNGDLVNQGLSNATISASTTPTYINNGKIGKALSGGRIKIDSATIGTIFNNKACSMAFWYNNSGATGSNHAICGTSGNSNGTNGTEPRQWDFFNYPTKNDFHWSMGSIGNGVLNGIIPDNTWIHFAFVLGDGKFTIYKNGSVIWQGNSNPTFTTYAYDYYINFGYAQYMNDFRIYDHALSTKEVKDLAKGLVLHYRLAGPGQQNLVKNSTNRGDRYSYFILSNELSEPLVQGQVYTITINANLSSDRQWIGVWSDMGGINLCNTQARNDTGIYKWTVTCDSNSAGRARFSVFCSNNPVGQMQGGTPITGTCDVEWVKLEKGSVATPWCPNPADALYHTMGYDNNIEYDCSGYRRNGTKNGNITWDIDSPRYTTSYRFNTGSDYIKTNFSATMDELSISFWVKPSSSDGGYSIICSNYNNPSGGLWLATNCESCSVWAYRYAYMNVSGSLANNVWHHCVYTFKNGVSKWYVDGEEKTLTQNTYTGTTMPITDLTIGNSYTGTSWNTKRYGNLSDFRLYCTALSAEDIAELYHSAVIVDNTGKSYAYEYFEAN